MKPASILVTDDESSIRLMLRTALQAGGYNVSEAANGRQALEAVKRQHPDLMVLDLNMPVLDGMAVLEEMKRLVGVQKPRVIVLTAYGSIPAAVKATRLGAVDFLEKPITPAELRESVRGVLEEPAYDTAPVVNDPAAGYEDVLARIRKAMRSEDFASAETLLMQAADRQQTDSAEYFNLLGILYEVQGKWRLARKCYGKAMRADKNYEPAQINMRRIFELTTLGKSSQVVVLGDESHAAVLARLAKAQIEMAHKPS